MIEGFVRWVHQSVTLMQSSEIIDRGVHQICTLFDVNAVVAYLIVLLGGELVVAVRRISPRSNGL